ncbi:MAG: GNAT family N-acetyltransferase [Actinomycetes bacterium]
MSTTAEPVVRIAREAEAAPAAALHAQRITEGFLPTLGPPFLARLYRRIVRDPGSFLVVAVEDGRVVGMCACTEDLGALYRAFVLRDGAIAGLRSAPRILRSLPRVIETLRYPKAEDAHDLPPAEVLAVAVDATRSGEGIGRAVVEAAVAEFDRRSTARVKVVAGGANDAALGLYRATGFLEAARIEVHAGTGSVVLVRSAP